VVITAFDVLQQYIDVLQQDIEGKMEYIAK